MPASGRPANAGLRRMPRIQPTCHQEELGTERRNATLTPGLVQHPRASSSIRRSLKNNDQKDIPLDNRLSGSLFPATLAIVAACAQKSDRGRKPAQPSTPYRLPAVSLDALCDSQAPVSERFRPAQKKLTLNVGIIQHLPVTAPDGNHPNRHITFVLSTAHRASVVIPTFAPSF